MSKEAAAIADRMTEGKVANLQTRRYNSLSYDVATLNDQINELVSNSEALENEIEVYEKRIREARKMIARNDRNADKLRQKRGIVAKAAFDAAAIDQP